MAFVFKDKDSIQWLVDKIKSVTTLLKTTINNTIDAMFPIGSVYITTTNTNPSTFLKGTWERFGQGRTLVGEGTGNDGSTSMSFTANSTGGKYNHSMPRDDIGYIYYGALLNSNGNQMGVHDHDKNMKTKISLLQPYITVYFWKRTA